MSDLIVFTPQIVLCFQGHFKCPYSPEFSNTFSNYFWRGCCRGDQVYTKGCDRLLSCRYCYSSIPLENTLETNFALCHISVQFSCSVVSDYLQPHGLQHARPPCPSPTPWVNSHSCPLSQWCHPTISSSAIPFSCCLQSFPALGSFLMNQLFSSGGWSIVISASASVLPMNIQDWFPLGWTGWISLLSKGLSKVSNTTVQKHQFFSAQLYL